MRAKEIMTHRVITISEKATILDAGQLMLKRRIGGLPVVDPNGSLVGIITEGDLLRRTELATEKKRSSFFSFFVNPGQVADEYASSHGRFVGEVMSTNPITVAEDAGLDQIVALFERHRIRRVPVISDGQIVGIVTRSNVVKALLKTIQYPAAINTMDADIRLAIIAEMEKNAWAPTATVDVSVSEAVVTLSGTIFDTRDRAALKVLAENVPGVREVRDSLVWLEPYSGIFVEGDDVKNAELRQ
jgi:CBS domain-containing protein